MKESISIGVTGHRKITIACSEKIKEVLTSLSEKYLIDKVYSPLAEGADREVAKFFIENNSSTKLIVPLPFDQNLYIDTFTNEQSKIEFQGILSNATSTYIIPNILHKKSKNYLYKLVGENVVDQSNIIVAIWNGKESNGLGGTAEIVQYAQKKKKTILYINSETCEVFHLN